MNSNFTLLGVCITLNHGLIVFYRSNTNWQNLCFPEFYTITPTTFQHENIQKLFMTGLLENLKDMNTVEKRIYLRYIWQIDHDSKTKNDVFDHTTTNITSMRNQTERFKKMQYFDYAMIKNLEPSSDIYQFCNQYTHWH